MESTNSPSDEKKTVEWFKAHTDIPPQESQRILLAQSTDNTAVMQILSLEGNVAVRMALANNQNLPSSHALDLAHDDFAGVRRIVASHPNLPHEGYALLLQDEDWAVALQAVQNFTENTPDDLWKMALDTPYPRVFQEVLRHRDYPRDRFDVSPGWDERR